MLEITTTTAPASAYAPAWAQATIKATRARIGAMWFELALSWSRQMPETKAQRLDAIRALRPRAARRFPEASSLAALDALLTTLAAALRARRKAVHPPVPPASSAVLGDSPVSRLRARALARLRQSYEDWECSFRVPGHCDDADGGVALAPTPADAGMVDYGRYIRPYRGEFRDWSVWEYSRTLLLSPVPALRAARAGLTEAGGMVTLGLACSLAPRGMRAGEEVWLAEWLRQGRGHSVVREQGWIARVAGEVYHSTANASVALRGARKKAAAVAEERVRLEEERAAEQGRRARRLAEYGDRRFTVADARALGLCPAGIASWCALAGIDPDRGATGAQILAAVEQFPRREALRFVRHYMPV